MRIDTARNQLDAAIELLTRARHQLDDLHVLAYDRRAAVDRVNVAGGERDYALDTHGDPEARRLLREGMTITDRACADLAIWTNDVTRFLSDGQLGSRRTPRTITADEHADALEAQRRRQRRGEYTPHRTYPQPQSGT